MVFHKGIVSVFIVLLFSTSCVQKTEDRYVSREGGFSVVMPGEVKTKILKENTPVGTFDIHVFYYEKDSKAFLVGYSDYYPPSIVESTPLDSLYTATINGAVSAVQGEIYYDTEIRYGEHHGREVCFFSPPNDLLLIYRYYIVGSRLYQVGTIFPERVKSKEEFEEFLNSFEILD